MAETVGLALLYPELLGTYGDGGNAVVLARRLAWRGLRSELVTVTAADPVPAACDLYLMGGGEDGPQALAARRLAASGALGRAVDGGAAVLAVCAGLQVLGRRFTGPDGVARDGLGLLDCETRRGAGRRRVGELLVRPREDLGLPDLTGYENHGGVTSLGPEGRPLGRVLVGRGNDAGDGSEGVMTGRVLGTYLHGPVLARNPALADLLLSWVVGPLEPLADSEVAALRQERIGEARRQRWAAARAALRRARGFINRP